MNILKLHLFAFTLLFSIGATTGLKAQERISATINSNWLFFKGDTSMISSSDKWQNVSIPHSWNTLDVMDDEPGYYRGEGWYKKTIYIPYSWKEKEIYLYFEGAAQVAEIFINGKPVGKHTGSYTAFSFPISKYLEFNDGKNAINEIVVKVNNSHNDDIFINYVNACTKEAKRLTPNGKNLIAPYGTKDIKFDDKYLSQLDSLDIDFIAYQDEVGVQKTTADQTAGFYQNLNKFHKKSGKSKLWADVEIFEFEGKVYNSPLLPAPAERVIPQLEAVSEYVDKIFIYQYTGMLNKPGTTLFTGFDNGKSLYQSLVKEGWLKG